MFKQISFIQIGYQIFWLSFNCYSWEGGGRKEETLHQMHKMKVT